MNKKLFLKLGLVLGIVSVGAIAYQQKDNLTKAVKSSNVDLGTEESGLDDNKAIASSEAVVEDKDEKINGEKQETSEVERQEDKDGKEIIEKAPVEETTTNQETPNNEVTDNQENVLKPEVNGDTSKDNNTQESVEQATSSENIESSGQTVEEIAEKEEFYYDAINSAMQKQIDYINSIEDPAVKQSVQSSIGAAVSEATLLQIKYPEDSDIISDCLAKVTGVN